MAKENNNIERHFSQTAYTRLLKTFIELREEQRAVALVSIRQEFDPNFIEGTINVDEPPIFKAYDASMYRLVAEIMKHPKFSFDVKARLGHENFVQYVFMTAYRSSMYRNSDVMKKRIDFCIEVLKQVKDAMQVDMYGSSLLHYACEDRLLLPIVEYLISREDVDIEAQDGEGNTPLEIASYNQNRMASSIIFKEINRRNICRSEKKSVTSQSESK